MRERHRRLYIAALQPEPAELLARLGVVPGIIPKDRIFAHGSEAVTSATHGQAKWQSQSPPRLAEPAESDEQPV